MTNTAIPSASGRTQASALVDQLRRDIVAGVHAPGTKLKISDLALQYGISVIPMREALARLSTSGLVAAEDQRGFRVTPVSIAELHDLAGLRRTLEMQALRESITRGGIDWETRLIAAHHRLSRLAPRSADGGGGFAEDWDAAHIEFHLSLLSACESPWLMRFVGILGEQMNRYRHLSTRVDERGARNIAGEHTAILDAALNGNAEHAAALLGKHFAHTESDAQRALEQMGLG